MEAVSLHGGNTQPPVLPRYQERVPPNQWWRFHHRQGAPAQIVPENGAVVEEVQGEVERVAGEQARAHHVGGLHEGAGVDCGRRGPGSGLRGVESRPCEDHVDVLVDGGREHHAEGALAAVEVVAAVGGAEHRSGEVAEGRLGMVELVGQEVVAAGDGVPDDEAEGVYGVEQHAAMAAVELERERALDVRAAERRRGGGGGYDVRERAVGAAGVLQEAQNRRRRVELAVEAEDVGVGEEGTSRLADGRRAEGACRMVRREAEEDLADEILRQHPPRCRHLTVGFSVLVKSSGILCW